VELRQRVTAAVRAQFGRPTGFWGRAAGLLMAHRTSNRRRNVWAVSLLDVRPEDRVLEIGFGPGIAIRELGRLARKGYVCGIDHSELMLRRAKRLNAEGLRRGVVELRLGSVPEDLPAFDEPFDKILAVNATMFWREPVAPLEELRRLLRSGGLIAVALYRTCPRRLLWPFASTRSWVGPQPQRDVGWLHRLPYRSHQVVT
jgi:SAM-dependent methyltransferase